MKTTIARAHPEDFPEIVTVWEASVRATHHFLPEADILFFKPLVRDVYLAAVDLHCARDEAGEILGFVGVAAGMIEMLFVAPARFGQGIGSLLLRHAVTALGATRVDVNEQNPRAAGFYEHHGFRTTGRSPVDATGKPYPLLHMELPPAQDRSDARAAPPRSPA